MRSLLKVKNLKFERFYQKGGFLARTIDASISAPKYRVIGIRPTFTFGWREEISPTRFRLIFQNNEFESKKISFRYKELIMPRGLHS